MPGMYAVQILTNQSIPEVLLQINADPRVRYAEPNYIRQLEALPTDSEFPSQWGLLNTGQRSSVNGQLGIAGMDINVLPAWEVIKGWPNIIVAVLDTGVGNHPDLVNNRVPGWDFAENRADGATDIVGHGTAVTGVVVAAINGIGTVGVAPNVKIMNIRVDVGNTGVDAFIRGVNFACQNGAHILNMSFSLNHSNAFREAMEACPALIIVAVNNRGINVDTNFVAPASYNLPNQLTVASINRRGHLASNSSFGAIGVAALMLSVNPNLTTAELRRLIVENTRPLPSLSGITQTGILLDATAAVNAALATLGGNRSPPAPTTGSIRLNIVNVSFPFIPTITVNRINHNVVAGSSHIIGSLQPGTYPITTNTVTIDDIEYRPTISPNSAQVTAGNTANVNITYQITHARFIKWHSG